MSKHTPEGVSWIYILAGVITALCAYTDWKPGQRGKALFYLLCGVGLIVAGVYWWLFGGNF